MKACQLLGLEQTHQNSSRKLDLDSITCPTLIPKQPARGLPSQISLFEPHLLQAISQLDPLFSFSLGLQNLSSLMYTVVTIFIYPLPNVSFLLQNSDLQETFLSLEGPPNHLHRSLTVARYSPLQAGLL